MSISRAVHAAAGALVLAAAVIVPSGPALADSVRSEQWYLKSLKVNQAQAISTGSGVTVAIVDTGVYPHRDLAGNLLPGTDELTGKDDGRSDKVGHGTHMAGLIAARGRDGDGILGVAPSAKILPIKGTNKETIEPQPVADGIDYAVAHKAGVINVSVGGQPAFALLKSTKAAVAANVVVVAAVGNDSVNSVAYPAAAAGVLAVGATDESGKHWTESNTGSAVQICAPGVGIISTAPGNKYNTADGTSDATAIVSGAAALIRAKFPQLSAAEVIHRITATADDNGPPGRDDQCGYGELNIVKALTADVPPLGADGASASVSPSASDSADVPTAPATSGNAAGPDTENKSSSAPLVVGVVVVVLLVAGLVGFVAMRRRA